LEYNKGALLAAKNNDQMHIDNIKKYVVNLVENTKKLGTVDEAGSDQLDV
jgi:hypothetical protein